MEGKDATNEVIFSFMLVTSFQWGKMFKYLKQSPNTFPKYVLCIVEYLKVFHSE